MSDITVRMNIFISNDDGVESKGLTCLANQLSKLNKVMVIAPDGNRSACSHSLTIHKPIKFVSVSEVNNCKVYSLSGTPADCVKFSKLMFPEFNADIVVSGINKGHNLGSDILYSGTVSIACESAFFGNVSFAFSCFSLEDSDFEGYAYCAEKLINYLLPFSDAGDIWNINFPNMKAKDVKGFVVTKLGKQIYSDRYEKISENVYQLTGELLDNDLNDADCDVEWIKRGYVTITPILFNKTNYDKIREVKDKCIQL